MYCSHVLSFTNVLIVNKWSFERWWWLIEEWAARRYCFIWGFMINVYCSKNEKAIVRHIRWDIGKEYFELAGNCNSMELRAQVKMHALQNNEVELCRGWFRPACSRHAVLYARLKKHWSKHQCSFWLFSNALLMMTCLWLMTHFSSIVLPLAHNFFTKPWLSIFNYNAFSSFKIIRGGAYIFTCSWGSFLLATINWLSHVSSFIIGHISILFRCFFALAFSNRLLLHISDSSVKVVLLYFLYICIHSPIIGITHARHYHRLVIWLGEALFSILFSWCLVSRKMTVILWRKYYKIITWPFTHASKIEWRYGEKSFFCLSMHTLYLLFWSEEYFGIFRLFRYS